MIDPLGSKVLNYSAKPVSNLKAIYPEINTFEDITKKGLRLNVAAHGVMHEGAAVAVGAGGQAFDAAGISQLLSANGMDRGKYYSIRTLICYSGEGGENSFGARLARSIGLPVKSFMGTVSLPGGDPRVGTYPAMSRIRVSHGNWYTRMLGHKYHPVTYLPR